MDQVTARSQNGVQLVSIWCQTGVKLILNWFHKEILCKVYKNCTIQYNKIIYRNRDRRLKVINV